MMWIGCRQIKYLLNRLNDILGITEMAKELRAKKDSYKAKIFFNKGGSS